MASAKNGATDKRWILKQVPTFGEEEERMLKACRGDVEAPTFARSSTERGVGGAERAHQRSEKCIRQRR